MLIMLLINLTVAIAFGVAFYFSPKVRRGTMIVIGTTGATFYNGFALLMNYVFTPIAQFAYGNFILLKLKIVGIAEIPSSDYKFHKIKRLINNNEVIGNTGFFQLNKMYYGDVAFYQLIHGDETRYFKSNKGDKLTKAIIMNKFAGDVEFVGQQAWA